MSLFRWSPRIAEYPSVGEIPPFLNCLNHQPIKIVEDNRAFPKPLDLSVGLDQVLVSAYCDLKEQLFVDGWL
jgi:hypothetical protein